MNTSDKAPLIHVLWGGAHQIIENITLNVTRSSSEHRKPFENIHKMDSLLRSNLIEWFVNATGLT
jgi:hypothetical protein